MPSPEPQEPPRPPPGATPELALLLSGVADPAHRDEIVRAWHELSEGVQDHALTQAAALFAAVLRAHEARLRQVMVPKTPENAPSQKPEEARANVIPNPRTMDAVQRIVAAEVDRAVAAASAVQARNLKIACGACFFAGAFFCALLVLFFHMALAR